MLYLVSTPIGNLGDITLRALETLKRVDYVVSEDTRKTGFLLKHFEIKKPQISFHEYNETKNLPGILRLLSEGKEIALVTDAGTPGISDPGFLLVRAAIQAGIQVTALPGATAFVPALVLSGLALHSFTFRGFPPHKPAQRKNFLAADADSIYTLIYYESPYRLKAFLKDCLDVFGDRYAAVANDLTKFYEKIWRGSLSEIIQTIDAEELRGEFVVVISAPEGRNSRPSKAANDLSAKR